MLVSSGHIEYAPLLAELHGHCFPVGWSKKEMENLLGLPSTIAWVTEDSFLICSHVLDEMEILTIGVLPDKRKQHLASLLLEDLMTYAQSHEVRKIFLEVSIQNKPAQGLYTKFGFVRSGIRKAYYSTPTGPEDALCLVKKVHKGKSLP